MGICVLLASVATPSSPWWCHFRFLRLASHHTAAVHPAALRRRLHSRETDGPVTMGAGVAAATKSIRWTRIVGRPAARCCGGPHTGSCP